MKGGLVSTLKVGKEEYQLDFDGHLEDPNEWTREAAESFATEDGITLTDEHWRIINFLRDYYKENEVPPSLEKFFLKEFKNIPGIPEAESASSKKFHKSFCGLFPMYESAAKYAGLPKPFSCV